MSNVNNITDEVLYQSIREIMESADLNVMTSKLVRNELKIKLNVEDLESRKKQINSIINEVLNELSQKSKKQNKVKDIKSEPFVDNKSEDISKNIPKKESNQSDDSSSDDISDEQLARKLHNEELVSKRRTTRNKPTKSGKKGKDSDRKNNKKKVKDNSDESDTEKPKKKGYLKPCILSPDLANFLGESEMARHEVVKRIWSYVKENNLFDPKNKQFVICDNQLNKIFGRKRVRMFGMMKFLGKHIN